MSVREGGAKHPRPIRIPRSWGPWGCGGRDEKVCVCTKSYVCDKERELTGIRMLESFMLSVICKHLPSRSETGTGLFFPCR